MPELTSSNSLICKADIIPTKSTQNVYFLSFNMQVNDTFMKYCVHCVEMKLDVSFSFFDL